VTGVPQAPTEASRGALVFSHANGFPAGTYRHLLTTLGQRFDVSHVDRFGHDSRYPVTRGWPGLVRQLIDHVEALPQGARPWLVGHSLGGYLSVLAAAKLGDGVSGVVLLDSPLIEGRGAIAIRWGRRLGLDRYLMPLTQTARRRSQWPDIDAVHAHFADKPAFARWHADVLRDYARHGTVAVDAGRRLHFDPEEELRIYRSLPTRTVAAAARACTAPIAFVGGSHSREVRHIGLDATRRVVARRLAMVEGGHLFPMERPEDTVAAILAAIDGMDQGAQPATRAAG